MKKLLTLGIMLLFANLVIAKEPPNRSKQLSEVVQSAHQSVGFNGAVLVGNRTNVMFYQHVGFADKTKRVPLRPDHLFSPGSITKEFSTLAIMQLVAADKLDYNDTLDKYLPFLPNWRKNISIQHIMTHTSGLPNLNWFIGIESEHVEEQVRQVKELLFTPGQGFQYGNMNIVLRGYIVEAITNQDYPDYVQQQIFNKAGMKRASQPIGMENLTEQVAFHEDPNALEFITSYMTAMDLYRFEVALWNGSLINPDAILKALPGDHHSGSNNRANFDFGSFEFDQEGQLSQWQHDGSSWPSHHNLKYHDLENDLIIILMSNDGNKSTLFELKNTITELFRTNTLTVPISWQFKQKYSEQGFEAAYEILLKQTTDNPTLESNVNVLGYWLFKNSQLGEAKQLFKANVEQFPKSANAHDSYAEVLIAASEIELAKTILLKGIALAEQQQKPRLLKSLKRQLAAINK